jgi:hypothetical protein
VIGYTDHMVPEVQYRPHVSTELVMLSIRGLAKAFSSGIDSFMVDLFADKARGKAAEQRFRQILHTLPFKDQQ